MVLPHLLVLLLTLLLSTTAHAIKVNNPVLKASPTSSTSSTTTAASSCPSSNNYSHPIKALARPSFDTQLSTLYQLHSTLAQWRTTTIRNNIIQETVQLYSHGRLPFGHHDTPNAHLTGDYDHVIDLDVAATMVAEIEVQIQALEQELKAMGCEEYVLRQAARGSSEVEVMQEWIRKNGRIIKVKTKGLEMRPRWGL